MNQSGERKSERVTVWMAKKENHEDDVVDVKANTSDSLS